MGFSLRPNRKTPVYEAAAGLVGGAAFVIEQAIDIEIFRN